MDLEELLKQVNADLKSKGYLRTLAVKYPITRVYFQSWQSERCVGVEVVNAHNDYRSDEQKIYRDVCKELIDMGYVIDMVPSCYINVKHKNALPPLRTGTGTVPVF